MIVKSNTKIDSVTLLNGLVYNKRVENQSVPDLIRLIEAVHRVINHGLISLDRASTLIVTC